MPILNLGHSRTSIRIKAANCSEYFDSFNFETNIKYRFQKSYYRRLQQNRSLKYLFTVFEIKKQIWDEYAVRLLFCVKKNQFTTKHEHMCTISCAWVWVWVCSPVFAFVCLFTSNLKFIVTGLRFVHTIFYHSNKFVYTILHTKNEKIKIRTGSRKQ